jgi:hypothetical protein
MRAGVKAGTLVFRGGERARKLKELSKFQTKRRTEAMTLAKVYLTGDLPVKTIGFTLRVSAERAAQIIRLGIEQMKRLGVLRRAARAGQPEKAGRNRSRPT